MVMEAAPGAALIMVQAQIIFGALEIVLDVPARAAQPQAAGFGGRAMEVRQITMVGFRGVRGPIDHQPALLQLALGFFEPAGQVHLLPRQAGALLFAVGRPPATGLPNLGGQGPGELEQAAGARGGRVIDGAVLAVEHGGHFLRPAGMFLRGDLQEKLQAQGA
jgi:hypothetical protein